MAQWHFSYVGDEKINNVYLELRESAISVGGSAIAPFLHFSPQLSVRNGMDQRNLYGEGALALSGTLYDRNQTLLFTSGYQPYSRNISDIYIPAPKEWIEEESRRHQTDVTFLLSWALLHNIGGEIKTSVADQQHLRIPKQQWLEWLPRWGYPRTRTVEIAIELPAKLASQQPKAQETWTKTVSKLQYAESKILSPVSLHDIEDGVKVLRDVVDGALRTWLVLWGALIPDKVDLHLLLQWVNSAIPQCNAPEGKAKAKPPISNDNMRLCSHAIALQNLITLTSPTHHFGTQSIYSQTDAESWLFMVLGELRSLPELWTQYPVPPSPLTAPNGLTTTPTPPHDP